jgi:hypothetical protein
VNACPDGSDAIGTTVPQYQMFHFTNSDVKRKTLDPPSKSTSKNKDGDANDGEFKHASTTEQRGRLCL